MSGDPQDGGQQAGDDCTQDGGKRAGDSGSQDAGGGNQGTNGLWRSIRNPSLGDLVALAALTISTVVLVGNAIVGARVSTLPPQEVVFRCNDYDLEASQCEDDILGVGAQMMTYINTGAAGYSAVITEETLSMTLPGGNGSRRIDLSWKYFSNIVQGQANSSKPAGAVIVSGRQVATHETQFRPRESPGDEDRRRNFYSWSEFVELVRTRRIESVELEFTTAMIVGKRRSRVLASSCTIEIEETRAANFKCDNDSCIRYAPFTCTPR